MTWINDNLPYLEGQDSQIDRGRGQECWLSTADLFRGGEGLLKRRGRDLDVLWCKGGNALLWCPGVSLWDCLARRGGDQGWLRHLARRFTDCCNW